MDDLEHFYLSSKESREMIEFLAQKRKIKNYKRKSSDELFQAIKENKDNEQQSKNKKIMDIIREKLINFLRIESKEIRKNFYNIEKRTNNYIQYKVIYKNPSHTTIHYLFLYLIINIIYNFSKTFCLSIV